MLMPGITCCCSFHFPLSSSIQPVKASAESAAIAKNLFIFLNKVKFTFINAVRRILLHVAGKKYFPVRRTAPPSPYRTSAAHRRFHGISLQR